MTFSEYKDRCIGKDGRAHYVYWVTDKLDGLHYIGKRSTKATSNLLLDFFGYGTSSFKKPLIKEYKGERFVTTILKVFDNHLDSALYESYLHTKFEVEVNPKFWNKKIFGLRD